MKDSSKQIKKLSLMVIFIVVIVSFFSLNIQSYFTLENLKSYKKILISLYENNPIIFLIVFFTIYILVTALSLPGATILTISGGVIFGLFLGTLVVSFASTIGATIAMIISRYFFKDWVKTRFEKQMEKINFGMNKDGVFYLFTLRLVPAIPFFVVNLIIGLTSLRLFTFFWVSQLGMLPATLVYINAGSKLNDIGKSSDILSPIFIGSFLILGMFPLMAKMLLKTINSIRVKY